ncbi:MAG: putative Calcium/calmodulin-dependent protein kinase [Chloroflexi bacterium]|nr:putative Calcium/calmodulin-dependent protein kinase [Chloroflexota bacterium]
MDDLWDLSFGKRVRQQRQSLGLTQAEMARRVACATITLRKIEAESLRPSVQIAERLAVALKLPAEKHAAFIHAARTASFESPPERETPSPAPSAEEIGQENLTGRFARGYQLGERIGSGSFAAVYRAVQPGVERDVAVKIILPQYANQPDFIRRFEAEAQLVARLEHPYIVPLYDYWREPNFGYLVMRLLRGGSLENRLTKGPLPLEYVLQVSEQVGKALGAAHRQGVVHRDLKSANILLDEEKNAYLADFGIAKNLIDTKPEHQTQSGQMIGSPAYISPEQIRSEPVRPETDIYSFGILLFEMLTGNLPYAGATPIDMIMQHLKAPLPFLSEYNPDLPPTLDPVIRRATSKNPADRQRDMITLLAEFQVAAGYAQTPGQTHGAAMMIESAAQEIVELENPYKGLRPFMEGDAQMFFGRESLVQELLHKMGAEDDLARFLAVVGPSGSGKSSAVKAGLIPALRRGGLPGSEKWFIVDMEPGAHPLEALEAALLRVAVNPPESLIHQFQEDERGLLRAVNRCLPSDPASQLVLVIDQFEELYTLTQARAEREQFLQSLIIAALDPGSLLRVVVNIRADMIDLFLQDIDFAELVNARSVFVPPLTPDELEMAIVGPARQAGLVLESGLVNRLVREVVGEPGALPLLQYALSELFERREGRRLTQAAYEGSGGVLSALGRRAEEIYAQLDERGHEAARQVFLRLVALSEGSAIARRRVLLSEFENLSNLTRGIQPEIQGSSPSAQQNPAVKAVIDRYARYQLLTFDRDQATRRPVVEIAHEALLTEWKRLHDWLEESRSDLRLQRQLAQAAAEWELAAQDESFLLQGSRLAQFEGWAEQTSLVLTLSEADFLRLSTKKAEESAAIEAARLQRELETAQKLAETERQRAEAQASARRRLQRGAAVLALSLLLVAILAAAAFFFAKQSNQNARLARARELASASLASLQSDPERSILLALEAVKTEPLWEAQNALHQGLYASHLRDAIAAHEGGIYGIAVSQDGNRLATASLDGTIKTWKIMEGRIDKSPQLTLPNPVDYNPAILGSGTTMAFSPDNSRLAIFGPHFSVLILDANTGGTLQTLSGHTAELGSLAFNPTGDRLLTSSVDGTARLWNISTGQKLVAFQKDQHEELVIAAFSPNGELIATGGTDSVVRIWDLSGALLAELPIENGNMVTALAYSADGSQLAAGTPFSHPIWDLSGLAEGKSPRLVLTIPGELNPVNGLYFNPDGSRLVTANSSGKTKLWDTAAGQMLLELLPSEAMLSSTLTPDGNTLFIGYENGQVKAWNTATLGNGEWLSLPYQYSDVHPNESRLLAWNLFDREHGIFDKTWWDIQGEVPQKINGYSIELGGPPLGDTQDDGLTRWAVLDENGLVKIYAAADGRFLRSLSAADGEAKIGAISLSSDGSRLFTASEDGSLRIWDTTTGSPLTDFQAGDQQQLVFSSPDGSLVVTHDQGSNPDSQSIIRIWDASTGKKVHELAGHAGRIFGGTFSSDGKFLLTSSADGTVKIWDVASAKELKTLSNFSGLPFSLSLSPNGSLLAVELSNLHTSLYDFASGQELLDLTGWWASFSPDSRHLTLGSTNEEMTYGYDLELADLVRLAESRVTRALSEAECQKYLHTPSCSSILSSPP